MNCSQLSFVELWKTEPLGDNRIPFVVIMGRVANVFCSGYEHYFNDITIYTDFDSISWSLIFTALRSALGGEADWICWSRCRLGLPPPPPTTLLEVFSPCTVPCRAVPRVSESGSPGAEWKLPLTPASTIAHHLLPRLVSVVIACRPLSVCGSGPDIGPRQDSGNGPSREGRLSWLWADTARLVRPPPPSVHGWTSRLSWVWAGKQNAFLSVQQWPSTR